MDRKIKLITVVGTNASGKSELGIRLAQHFNGEILSADSRQIFRGFDLCCGKVTAEERALVPHHMLDLRSLGESYSVADFQSECYRLIPEIHGRGRVPFLVGGTGLYVSAVVQGYNMMQGEPDPALRAELEEKSLEELYALLPPSTLEVLMENPSDRKNKRRLIRLVEKARAGGSSEGNQPRYDCLQLGLTWPMEVLQQRIDLRLEKRLQEGMVDEVRDYLRDGGDPQALIDLGLEYRFIYRYLTGCYADEAEFKAALSTAIRQFSKRQLTWFRRDRSIRWLDGSSDYHAEAIRLTEEFLQ